MSQKQKRWHLNSSLPAKQPPPGADKAQDSAPAPKSLSPGRALLSLALVGAVSFLPKLKGGSCGMAVGKELVAKQPSEASNMSQPGPQAAGTALANC